MNRVFSAGFVTIGLLGLGTVGVVAWFWDQVGPTQQAGLLISGMGVIGTLTLAFATFWTVRQNTRDLNEVKKEREKPLVIDEIRHVIQYAIDSLENDIEELESDPPEMDWVYTESLGDIGMTGPRPVFQDVNPDRTAEKRLEREDSDLWEKLEEREELALECIDKSNEIIEIARPRFETYIHNTRVTAEVDVDSDILVFLDAAFRETDEFGESSQLYDVWENHGRKFVQILNEIDEMAEFRRMEDELLKLLPC